MRISSRYPRLLVGALVAGACFVQSLPAAAAPAPLPEWGDVKKKPAPLPSWDASAKKPAPSAKKPKKKPAAATPQPVTPAEPEPATPPEAVPEPEPIVTAPPEPAPAEPEPAPPVVSEPAPPEPEGPSAKELELGKQAERTARGEIITGGVLTFLGLGGVGAMTAGMVKLYGTDDLGENGKDKARTMIAAGAVSGAFGLALGLALIVDGVRDLKAARPKRSARVRVAPTFGGLVITGRF